MERSYYPRHRTHHMCHKDFNTDIKTLVWKELFWITYYLHNDKWTSVDVVTNVFDIRSVKKKNNKVIITIRE